MGSHEMCWFAGVLVTRSSSDRPGYSPLFEESIVIVAATDEHEAKQKIGVLAAAEAQSYGAVGGGRVTWELVHVLDVQELRTPPEDGATVYSRHFRDYEAYRRFEPLLDGSID